MVNDLDLVAIKKNSVYYVRDRNNDKQNSV
jgi:hypothetical protein